MDQYPGDEGPAQKQFWRESWGMLGVWGQFQPLAASSGPSGLRLESPTLPPTMQLWSLAIFVQQKEAVEAGVVAIQGGKWGTSYTYH